LSAPSYTPQLRPLSVGEMLDAGFRLFSARFWTLILCVLVPIVPMTILSTALQASVDPNAFDLDTTETADSGTALAGTLVGSVIQFAAAALAIAACFKAISAAYLGERAGAGESLRYALGRLLPLLVAYFVVLVIVVIGFVLLIIPGIWIAVKLSMVFPALVFERKGPFASIGRSWTLTGGGWWRTFGTLLVVFLITFVIQLVLGGVVGGALGASDTVSELTVAIVLTLVNLIALALTYPLWAAVTSVVYYDLRVRNEGFDLQLLAEGMGAEAPRFESAPERPAAPPPDAGGGFAPPSEGSATSS
jgi:hypothetical protein